MAPASKTSGKDKNAAGSATKSGKKDAPAKTNDTKSDTASATTTTPAANGNGTHATSHISKPDQAAYNAEQEDIKKQMEEANKRLAAVKEKIARATDSGFGDERVAQLKFELEVIREQQGDAKSSREKTLSQVKSLQENIQRKVSDLQAKKGKIQFKNVTELDAYVRKLEEKIDSGTMKVLEEKRTIQEITGLKRQRRTIESLQGEQESIDADRAKVDELRQELDNPESKALSERYDEIKAELDALRKESDDAFTSRQGLFDQRDTLQRELDTLYAQKRESSQKYREASDRYWAKVQEERARKAEKARAARRAIEEEKKKELVDRIREEAAIPAFQTQIEDCQSLIDYFSGNATTSSAALEINRAEVAGVPKLNIRTVTASETDVVLKKESEDYFAPVKKGKKGPKATTSQAPNTDKFSVPLSKLTALASLSIPPPTSVGEVSQTIENLKTKKDWLVANQEMQTAENKAKAEKEIASLLRSLNGNGANNEGGAEIAEAVTAES
ncbi:hypothetical protein FRB99_007521 [Tulasnella sp. 403]|nr:hypothetical protein FRB99_007521 [Tulasnella sp. 403]